MPKGPVFLVSCALLLSLGARIAGAAEADMKPMPRIDTYACLGAASDDELAACIAARLAAATSCAGSVEERITCLEERMRAQEVEIVTLKRALRRLGTARVHPLATLER